MNSLFDKARQLLEITRQDRDTRSSGGFASIERDLPKRNEFSSISLLDKASSYFGKRNPIAARIDPETECVWLFDTTAYRPVHVYPHAEQPYQAELIAAFFKKNTGKDVSKAVASIADKIGLDKEEDGDKKANAEKTIAHRLQPFVDTIAPARFVEITLPDARVEKLGPGGPSAVSQQTVTAIQEHNNGDKVHVPAIPDHLTPHGPMTIHFAAPEGWMVISGETLNVSIYFTNIRR